MTSCAPSKKPTFGELFGVGACGKDSGEEAVVKISEMGVERRFSLLKLINYLLSQFELSRDFFNTLRFEMIAMRAVVLFPASK